MNETDGGASSNRPVDAESPCVIEDDASVPGPECDSCYRLLVLLIYLEVLSLLLLGV
jgi:hypothetical protein